MAKLWYDATGRLVRLQVGTEFDRTPDPENATALEFDPVRDADLLAAVHEHRWDDVRIKDGKVVLGKRKLTPKPIGTG